MECEAGWYRPNVSEHIFLEEAILPSITKHVAHWKRYIDNTFAYIDPSKIEFVLEKLNSYHLTFSSLTKLKKKNRKLCFSMYLSHVQEIICCWQQDLEKKLIQICICKYKYAICNLKHTCTHTMETGSFKNSKINFNLFQWKITWRWIGLFKKHVYQSKQLPAETSHSIKKQ